MQPNRIELNKMINQKDRALPILYMLIMRHVTAPPRERDGAARTVQLTDSVTGESVGTRSWRSEDRAVSREARTASTVSTEATVM